MAEELQKLNLNSDASVAPRPVSPMSSSAPRMTQKTKNGWLVIVVIVLLGVASGFGLFKLFPSRNATTEGVSSTGQLTTQIKVGDVVGSTDESTFKDTATGVLESGTLSGEGSHSLLREGGPSKTANLTSSVIDLDQFVGAKIEVWGETFSAQKSGWLMDVGRVKVLELNAQKPQ